MKGITLSELCAEMERIAPLRYAEDWDQVGLLIEPLRKRRIKRVLLTIDLTQPVMDEAKRIGVEIIVAYHPPLFRPLARLRPDDAKQRIALEALAAGIAVYSPHTALDAAPGGVNDWLVGLLPKGSSRSLQPRAIHPGGYQHRICIQSPSVEARGLSASLEPQAILRDEDDALEFFLSEAAWRQLGPRLRSESVTRIELADVPMPECGQGRIVTLAKPLGVEALIRRIKKGLGLRRLRAAIAPRHAAGEELESIALCAGAGASVIGGSPADLYWTGEMRHHDVLEAVEAGRSVVLCEHSNTERVYLPQLAETLETAFDSRVEFLQSEEDAEPLQIV